MGAPGEVLAQARQAQEDDICWVLPECWDACVLFGAVQTQWRYAGMGGVRVGLDYPGVEIVRRKIHLPRQAFLGLQVMETAALKHWFETAKKT